MFNYNFNDSTFQKSLTVPWETSRKIKVNTHIILLFSPNNLFLISVFQKSKEIYAQSIFNNSPKIFN